MGILKTNAPNALAAIETGETLHSFRNRNPNLVRLDQEMLKRYDLKGGLKESGALTKCENQTAGTTSFQLDISKLPRNHRLRMPVLPSSYSYMTGRPPRRR